MLEKLLIIWFTVAILAALIWAICIALGSALNLLALLLDPTATHWDLDTRTLLGALVLLAGILIGKLRKELKD